VKDFYWNPGFAGSPFWRCTGLRMESFFTGMFINPEKNK